MSEQPPELEQTTTGLPAADAAFSSPPALPPALIVGIGGSAGALDAYERFFVGLPLGSQMAFVVISHLDPHQESLMPEILQRCTVLHVEAVRDGTVIQADSVYVAPPGFSVAVRGGRLQLQALSQAKGHTIDAFFVSLAADQGQQAACVVLSGMGKDGTVGAQAIKAAGGCWCKTPTRQSSARCPSAPSLLGWPTRCFPPKNWPPAYTTGSTPSR